MSEPAVAPPPPPPPPAKPSISVTLDDLIGALPGVECTTGTVEIRGLTVCSISVLERHSLWRMRRCRRTLVDAAGCGAHAVMMVRELERHRCLTVRLISVLIT